MCMLVDGFLKEAFWPDNDESEIFYAALRGWNWLVGSPPAIGADDVWYSLNPPIQCHNLSCVTISGCGCDISTPYIMWPAFEMPARYNMRYSLPDLQKRISALINLLLLLWFVASGFLFKMRDRVDFVTAVASRTRSRRVVAWDVVKCCFSEMYYIF
jgi:hypothetical protein